MLWARDEIYSVATDSRLAFFLELVFLSWLRGVKHSYHSQKHILFIF